MNELPGLKRKETSTVTSACRVRARCISEQNFRIPSSKKEYEHQIFSHRGSVRAGKYDLIRVTRRDHTSSPFKAPSFLGWFPGSRPPHSRFNFPIQIVSSNGTPRRQQIPRSITIHRSLSIIEIPPVRTVPSLQPRRPPDSSDRSFDDEVSRRCQFHYLWWWWTGGGAIIGWLSSTWLLTVD